MDKELKKIENLVETNYMYVGDTILYTTDSNGNKATENVLDPNGGIVATKRFDGKYSNMYFKYTYDARGSIISILDPDINRVKGYGYDDYGNTTEVGDSNFINEVKYGGMIEDEASGLHYMNARHYNPTSGRFLTEDSYDDPNSSSLYSYAGSNPINYVDPTGHWSLSIGKAFLEVLAVASAVTETIAAVGAAVSAAVPILIGAACVVVVGVAVGCAISHSISSSKAKASSKGSSISSSTAYSPGSSSSFTPAAPNNGANNNGGVSSLVAIGAAIITSVVIETYTEPLLNGIAKSAEMSRVTILQAEILDKAEENVPTEGTGEADDIDTDILPDHLITKKNPGQVGKPNSSADIIDGKGNLKTRRWFDSNGKAQRDVDFTDHGNPKMHPKVPHEHSWDWSTGKGIRK